MKQLTFSRFSKLIFGVSAAAIFVTLVTGCMSIQPAQGGYGQGSYSSNVYRSGDAQGEMIVRYGRVRSVRPVAIDQGQSGVGIGTGAILGGLLGNKVGKGNGRKAATVLGAVAGGMGGAAVESNVRTVQADEIVVTLDSGNEIAVVQGAGQGVVPGDRVRVTGSGNNVRISR